LVLKSPPARRPTPIMPASVPVRTVPVAHAATASHSSVVKVLSPAGALTWELRLHRRRFSRHPLRLLRDALCVKRQFSGGRFEMLACDGLGVTSVLPTQHVPRRSPNDPLRDDVLSRWEGRPGEPASSGKTGLTPCPRGYLLSRAHLLHVACSGGWASPALQASPIGHCLGAVHTLQRAVSRGRHSCTHLSVEGACEREQSAYASCVHSRRQR